MLKNDTYNTSGIPQMPSVLTGEEQMKILRHGLDELKVMQHLLRSRGLLSLLKSSCFVNSNSVGWTSKAYNLKPNFDQEDKETAR